MNKNKKVAKIKYDNEKQRVVEITEVFNIQYAPLECFEKDDLTPIAMTEWFRGRGIPSWRDGLDDFLDNMGIRNKDVLLNKAFGLSLSDQYWLNPVQGIMDWSDINFFENDFNSSDYEMAVFDNKILDSQHIDLYSPNNTSDGMLKKTWIVGNDGKRYLLKGAYKDSGMEPFSEVLASMICQAIGLDCVEYTLEVLHGSVLSKCECFIGSDTELLSAYSILRYNGIDMSLSSQSVYERYMDILKSKGLEKVELNLAKMFILDYLTVNVDRHLGNFGVIRNVETLDWIRIAPNFDSGQSLLSLKKVYEMDFKSVKGSFFNEKDVDFEVALDMVRKYVDFDIDFNELSHIAMKWKEILIAYQDISYMSDERIDTIYQGLKYRIEKLKRILYS